MRRSNFESNELSADGLKAGPHEKMETRPILDILTKITYFSNFGVFTAAFS